MHKIIRWDKRGFGTLSERVTRSTYIKAKQVIRLR